eukprot:8610781-Pyramimonas_sp.AAC.1
MGRNKGKTVRTKKLHKPSKSERKKARSPGGFLGLMGGFLGLCAWTLWSAVKSEREKLEETKVLGLFGTWISGRLLLAL